jgi:hypothetical protein
MMWLGFPFAGLAFAAMSMLGLAGTALASGAPFAGHEPRCHQLHQSTAPPEVDRAFHERVPRPVMDQVCDPHSGHDDQGETRLVKTTERGSSLWPQ